MKALVIYLSVIFSVLGYIFIGYFTPREDFITLFCLYAFLFIAYLFLFRNLKKLNPAGFFGLGILFRLLFLFTIPALSDDYYRFIWDAKLVSSYENIYAKTPSNQAINFSGSEELLHKMNSSQYYSVYPPVQQLLFLPAAITDTTEKSLIILHLVILIGEFLLFYFLSRMRKENKISNGQFYLIWLNPLWIIEVNGNLHFEGWMLAILVGAIYFIGKNKKWLGALLWGISIGIKLIPILFLPFLLKWKNLKESFLISCVSLTVFSLLFFPFFTSTTLANYFSSIDLYYHKFEFNASLYFLLGYFGNWFSDLHPIVYGSKILIPLFLVFAFFLIYKTANKSPFAFWMNSALLITGYFIFATTVHPWYILSVLIFSVMCNFQYGVLWTGLVFLSYYRYTNDILGYFLSVSIEYVLLFAFLIYEYKIKIHPRIATVDKDV